MAGSIRVAGHTIAEHDIVNDKVDIKNATLDSTNTFNFANDSISGDKIDGGTISNFASTGIDDNASSTALTIDASGNVGIGTDSPGIHKLKVIGTTYLLDDLLIAGGLSKMISSDSGSNPLIFGIGSTERLRIQSNGDTRPGADNTYDLGTVSYRWDDVFATNGTIQTSDINEKQDIEELSEAEQRVAIAAKGLLRKYRWKSAVAEKGDDARIHFGIIAQDLKAAFEAEGLDAGRYGMFIHSEWWETEETYTDDNGAEKTRINTFDTEEEAPEGAVKKDRMGIRYSELLAFIIAAI